MEIIANNTDLMRNEAFFVKRNTVEVLFPCCEFAINTKIGGLVTKKMYTITVEKLNIECLLQVRISDLSDQMKMYIATVDLGNFENLRKDQSLHVTFAGFADNLIAILKNCRNGELLISLILDRDKYSLQFYEVRSFRNLVHLYLPVSEAPMSVILYHVNQTLATLQTQNASLQTTIQHFQRELVQKDNQISHYKTEISKLSTSLAEQQKIFLNRNNEEILKLRQDMQNLRDAKIAEENRLKDTINGLHSRVDQIQRENASLQEQKSQETKKCDALREEICILKSNAVNIKEHNEKMHLEINALKNLERKTEAHNNDLRKQVRDMQETIRKYDKIKSEFTAELEAERKVCQTKRNALQMASEEIANLNDVVSKQSKEIDILKKNVDWRTEVAFKQEAVVCQQEKELDRFKEKVKKLENALKCSQDESKDINNKLDVMKQLANQIESKYTERIAELTKDMEMLGSKDKFVPSKSRYHF